MAPQRRCGLCGEPFDSITELLEHVGDCDGEQSPTGEGAEPSGT